MQIIIDIPETTYNIIKEDVRFISDKRSDEKDVYLAIKNGIVLPVNHGDLIDRDELKKYTGWYNLATDKSIHAVLTSELYQIEPVIPAERGDDL